ncbi:hypothetical protein BC937DRAFT_88842 [Endogone sp. FLAS-F59071]|nr:hypothetical protein BC937DRAFT_88842 [Endogone sp. FLAS-F59071]|eukprot:RUS18364.1 hypothetical protein BC937DRAFT_88842 [Endogone sp. FLAS-F59071]
MSQPAHSIHRFVSIRQARDASTEISLQALWQLLGTPTLPSVATSAALNRLVVLVRSAKVPLIDALNGLHNTFLITANLQRLSVIVRAVTDLLLDNAEVRVAASTKRSSDVEFAVHPSQGQVHPYILMVRLKPECWTLLLSEFNYCFSRAASYLDSSPHSTTASDSHQRYSASLLSLLTSFLDTLFLSLPHQQTPYPATLLNRLFSLVIHPAPETFDPLREAVLAYLLSVPRRHPLIRSSLPPVHYTLLSSLVAAYANPDVHLFLSAADLRHAATILAYELLGSACDAKNLNLPTLPYVNLLASLRQVVDAAAEEENDRIANPQINVMWPALAYLLMDAQTIQDQEEVVGMMCEALIGEKEAEGLNPVVVNVALLPLFQVIAEGEEGKVGVRELAAEVIVKMEKLGGEEAREKKKDGRSIVKKITSEISSFNIIGILAHICSSTCDLLTRYFHLNPTFPPTTTTTPFSTPLPFLFTTPFLLHPSIATRHTSAAHLIDLAIPAPATPRFPLLLLFLHLLRHTSSETRSHILLVSLPALVHPSDPVTTSRVLRIAATLVEGTHETKETRFTPGRVPPYRDTRLAAVGVRMMLEVYKRQPRAWKQLRHVVGEWVKRRKAVAAVKGGREGGGGIRLEVEIAVLATVRDLCVFKPQETAEDLLPFLAALLKSAPGLHPASLCLIVDAVIACVRAEVVDPRAVWNVLLSHVADYAVEVGNVELLTRLCDFYGLVADKDEETDIYLDFKQTIFSIRVSPLLSHPTLEVRRVALVALIHFPPQDVRTAFPPSPKLLVGSILDPAAPQPVYEYAGVLSKLLRHEIEHMRRGLFKGAGEREKEKELTEGVEGARKRAESIADMIVREWGGGTVSPGLRSGFATAALFVYTSSQEGRAVEAKSEEGVKSKKVYRYLQTALVDVAAPDHLVVRVGAVAGWAALFETLVREGDEEGLETVAEEVMADLEGRLEGATVPGVCANVVMAMAGEVFSLSLLLITSQLYMQLVDIVCIPILPLFPHTYTKGFILALHRTSISSATAHATRLIRRLLDEYPTSASKSPSKLTSSLASSDEVRSAVAIVLGRLATCVVMDERVVREVVESLMAGVVEEQDDEKSNDASDWPAFSHGYALGHLLSFLTTSASKPASTALLAMTTALTLISHASSVTTSFNSALGAFMGLASAVAVHNVDKEAAEVVRAACDVSVETLRRFVELQGKVNEGKGGVLGAVWFLAAYIEAQWEGEEEEEEEERGKEKEAWELLESVAQMAVSMRNWALHYFHFLVPYAKLLQARLARRSSTAHLTAYNAQLQTQLRHATAPGSPATTRLCAVLALGALAGVRYLDPGPESTARSYLLGPEAPRELGESVWDALARMAGLEGAPGDLRGGRVAAVVIGRMVEVERRVRPERGGASTVMGSSSMEPRDYSRLTVGTSYLRAVFDGCRELSQRPPSASNLVIASILLDSLATLPTPLPPVNWFMLLTRLSSISPSTRLCAARFASKHAVASISLMEFLVAQLLALAADPSAADDRDVIALLVGEVGVGKVLELGGLERWRMEERKEDIKDEKRRGMDTMIRKVSVPASRCVEVVSRLVEVLSNAKGGSDSKELLQLLVSTLSNHLPATTSLPPTTTDNLAKLIAEFRALIRQEIVFPLIFPSWPIPAPISSTETKILRRAIECSVFDVTNVSTANDPMTSRTALAVCELVGLARTDAAPWMARVIRQRMLEGPAESLQEEGPVVDWIIRAVNADVMRQAGAGTTAGRQQEEDARLEWIVRVLDVLILTGDEEGKVERGIERMLRKMVNKWWWGDEGGEGGDTVERLAEMTFTLGEVVHQAGAKGGKAGSLQGQVGE